MFYTENESINKLLYVAHIYNLNIAYHTQFL